MNTRVQGQCQCGNLSFEFETNIKLEDIRLRSCDCSFCRGHATRCFSDPAGRAHISVRDETLLQRYRFAHETTDFLICDGCGIYLGAVISNTEGCWSTLNFCLTAHKDLPADPVSYGGQSRTDRIEQRIGRFTPTTISIGPRRPGCDDNEQDTV